MAFFPGLPTTTLQPAWAYTFNGLIFNEPSCQLIITHNFSMYIALPCPAAAHSNHCIHITLTPENSLHLTIVEKMISSRWNYQRYEMQQHKCNESLIQFPHRHSQGQQIILQVFDVLKSAAYRENKNKLNDRNQCSMVWGSFDQIRNSPISIDTLITFLP